MEMNEDLVLINTENVEEVTTEEITGQEEQTETVEEPVRTYTDDEVNEIVGKRLARERAKMQKENDRKYGRLERVLRAGTGNETVEEMTDTFENFYRGKGIDIPQEPVYSARDVEILAKVEAEEIIRSGFEEVIEEADRLNSMGVENMTARDKALFVKLTNHIKNTETQRELSKLGVKEDVYGSEEFKSFASKFEGSKTPIREIYEIYNKTQPKKELQTMGSIKHGSTEKGAVKDFYSREEAMKFTKEDFDRNPALFEAVEKSMRKW